MHLYIKKSIALCSVSFTLFYHRELFTRANPYVAAQRQIWLTSIDVKMLTVINSPKYQNCLFLLDVDFQAVSQLNLRQMSFAYWIPIFFFHNFGLSLPGAITNKSGNIGHSGFPPTFNWEKFAYYSSLNVRCWLCVCYWWFLLSWASFLTNIFHIKVRVSEQKTR